MIGTCRFCGQLREVNAPDQGRADEKASRSCDCAGSERYARKMATTEAVETICENYDLDDDQITVLQAIAHGGRPERQGGKQGQWKHLCEDHPEAGR